MSLYAAFCLAVVSLAAQDNPEAKLHRLIERLSGDRIQDREEATRQILDLGTGVLSALEKAASTADPEVRARLEDAIRPLKRRFWADSFWPEQPRSLTLDLQDVTAKKALEAILGPFDLRPSTTPHNREAEERRVNIKLRDATFWESVDALTAASGCDVIWQTNESIHLDLPGPDLPKKVHADCKPFRLFASSSSLPDTKESLISVYLALPPGICPTYGLLKDVEITDSKGRKIPFAARETGQWKEPRRRRDRICIWEIWRAALPADGRKGIDRVSVSGTLGTGKMVRCEKLEYILSEFKGPDYRQFERANFALLELGATATHVKFKVEFTGRGSGPDALFLLTTEDRNRRLVQDWSWVSVEPSVVNGGGSGEINSLGERDIRVLLYNINEVREIAIPFRLEGVPLPPEKE